MLLGRLPHHRQEAHLPVTPRRPPVPRPAGRADATPFPARPFASKGLVGAGFVPHPAGGVPLLTPLLVLCLLVAAGPSARAHDDPDHQLAELSARLAREPDSAALHLERAELHRFRRDWAGALADLQDASRLDPSMAAVDLALARLLLEAGNLPEARDAADRFVARSPDNVLGHLVRARMLLRSGEGPAAAAAFTRAIELDREHRGGGSGIQPDDYLDRARALADAGRSEEALRGLDEGLAALGRPITLQLLAIELDEKSGNLDAALARIAAIEARANRKETWMARRGDLLLRAGRPQEADRAYRDALAAIARCLRAFAAAPPPAASNPRFAGRSARRLRPPPLREARRPGEDRHRQHQIPGGVP